MGYLMLIKGNEKHVIHETDYKQEQKLHEMIEKYPKLINLPGVEEGDLLLPIAKEHKASDLMCVDNHGNIVIIEFKLDKNQTMRDIVAQILDYASTIWKESYEEFNLSVKEYLKKNYKAEDLSTVFFEKFKDEIDLSKFDGNENKWKTEFIENIVSNLNQGAFKLVICANKIPDDIKRVVEYLYSVHRLDLHCIEVDYFKKDDLEILVPKRFDFGKREAITSSTRRSWDYDKFVEDCQRKIRDAKTIETIRELYEFSEQNADKLTWGTGVMVGSFSYKVFSESKQKYLTLFSQFSNGRLQVSFGMLRENMVVDKIRDKYREKLNEIEGISLKKEDINRWPEIKMNVFNDKNKLNQLKAILEWTSNELRK